MYLPFAVFVFSVLFEGVTTGRYPFKGSYQMPTHLLRNKKHGWSYAAGTCMEYVIERKRLYNFATTSQRERTTVMLYQIGAWVF
jgi:hypothetical protein